MLEVAAGSAEREILALICAIGLACRDLSPAIASDGILAQAIVPAPPAEVAMQLVPGELRSGFLKTACASACAPVCVCSDTRVCHWHVFSGTHLEHFTGGRINVLNILTLHDTLMWGNWTLT